MNSLSLITAVFSKLIFTQIRPRGHILWRNVCIIGNRWKEIWTKFYLRRPVRQGFYCGDFHKTHIFEMTSRENFLYRLSWNSANKCGNYRYEFIYGLNTLRTGDADLRFYVTTVQDEWRRFAFLRYNCAGRVTQIRVFTLQLCRTSDADLRFYVTTVQDGWRRFAFLRYNCAERMTQICVFNTVKLGYICKFSLVPLHKGECFQRYHTLKHY